MLPATPIEATFKRACSYHAGYQAALARLQTATTLAALIVHAEEALTCAGRAFDLCESAEAVAYVTHHPVSLEWFDRERNAALEAAR